MKNKKPRWYVLTISQRVSRVSAMLNNSWWFNIIFTIEETFFILFNEEIHRKLWVALERERTELMKNCTEKYISWWVDIQGYIDIPMVLNNKKKVHKSARF